MPLRTTPRQFLALSCVLSLGLVGGCQTLDDFGNSLNQLNDGLGKYAEKPENTGPALAPASLPEFGIGDAFVYDSGRAIFVEDIKSNQLVWNGGGDYLFETTADFTGPNLEWSYTDSEDRKRAGSTTIKDGSESIWPLKVGKLVRVSTKSENIDPYTLKINEYDQWLTCKVPATETIEVPAGKFDTYIIECARYYKQWWMQTTTWWYAPKIGFYVKRDRSWNSGSEHSEKLLTYGPAPAKITTAAQKQLSQTVQTALEKNNSGDTSRSSQSSLRFAVTPLKTVQTDKGVWCRTYRQQLTAHSRTSEQIKSACRTDDGWVIEDDVSDETASAN